MTGATPGASSSGSSTRAPAVAPSVNNCIANASRPTNTSRPVNVPRLANAPHPANAPRPVNAPHPVNVSRPTNAPRPVNTICPTNTPRPAPVAESRPKNPGELPPIVGVNAPRWMLYPPKDTDRTMAWIRYRLGAMRRETWLNMQDTARQVAGLCSFDFHKIWKRQIGDHIALGSNIISKTGQIAGDLQGSLAIWTCHQRSPEASGEFRSICSGDLWRSLETLGDKSGPLENWQILLRL
ncbi:hypothetical protein FRC07_009152 [Ceratobasidium sp. 392]|nr:hypothetical protein FRC07_009152 [Ceratobasidium sp. 392]